MNQLQDLRQQYSDKGLSEQDLSADPFQQFSLWYQQAQQAGIPEANGFVLSTVSDQHAPFQRTVLMKSFDNNGFVFYTNHYSRKGQQIKQNQFVSMLFPWYPLHRQVEVQGIAAPIGTSASEPYFQTRPRNSQIGAWASKQSSVLENRDQLEQQIQQTEQKFKDQPIPCPDFWGGYIIEPHCFEFWQGRTHRVHDRLIYEKEDAIWQTQRLSP